MAPAIPTGYYPPSSKPSPSLDSNMLPTAPKPDSSSFDWPCASASTSTHPHEQTAENPSSSSMANSNWQVLPNSSVSRSESPRPPNGIDNTTSIDPANASSQKPVSHPGENSGFGWNENVMGEAGGPTGDSHADRNSDEWKQHRKNNHKEVERRRRETINDGITELKKIVPGTEKNKGEILKQAVRYIQHLKDTEAKNAEKWALEKLLIERALQDQSAKLEKLSRDHVRLEAENESLKRWIIELGEKATSMKATTSSVETSVSSAGLDLTCFGSSSTLNNVPSSSTSLILSGSHASTSGCCNKRDLNGSPRTDSSATQHDQALYLGDNSSARDTAAVPSIRHQPTGTDDDSESNIHHLFRSASGFMTGAQKRDCSIESPSTSSSVQQQSRLDHDRLTVKRKLN